MKYKPSEFRKTIIGVAAFVVSVLTTILAVGPDLIPDSWLPWIQVVIAVAGSYGIFQVRNVTAKRSGVAAPDESVADKPAFDGPPFGESTTAPWK